MVQLKIILATQNAGKLKEFQHFFSGTSIEFIPMNDLGLGDIEETGKNFQENALLKAHAVSKKTNFPAIADDSGLIIDALEGRPGIFSARYAGIEKNPQKNIEKVLEEMKDIPNEKRSARFHCCLAFVTPNKHRSPVICEANWEGLILKSSQGSMGFGYDPIFFVPEYQCSAAELAIDIKNTISHRAQALQKLREALV
jgi:XTP/dITP diphosphohydrolase